MPYSNVICGEYGGFVVTANGGGFDYFSNSNLSRSTTWQNNPVLDNPCEEIYMYDGTFVRLNKLNDGGYVKHAAGYTVFKGIANGTEYSVEEDIIADGKGKSIQINLAKSTHSNDFEIIFKLNAMLGDLPKPHMLFDTAIDNNTVKITNAFNNKCIFIRTELPCELIPDKAFLCGIRNDMRLCECNTGFYNPSHTVRITFNGKKTQRIRIILAESYEFIK